MSGLTRLDMPLQDLRACKTTWAKTEVSSAGKIKVVQCRQSKRASCVGPALGSS